MKPSDYDIRSQYLRFNRLFFDNKLPEDLTLEFDPMRAYDRMGVFKFPKNPDGDVDYTKCKIELDSSYDYTQEGYDGILLHEMVHAYVILVLHNQSMENTGHHSQFQEELDRVDAMARARGIDMPSSEASSIRDFAKGAKRTNLCLAVMRKPNDPEGFIRFSVMQPSVFKEIVTNFQFKLKTLKYDPKAVLDARLKGAKGIRATGTDTHPGEVYYNKYNNVFKKGLYSEIDLYLISSGELALTLAASGMKMSQIFLGNNYWVTDKPNFKVPGSDLPVWNRPDIYALLNRWIKRAIDRARVMPDGIYQGSHLLHAPSRNVDYPQQRTSDPVPTGGMRETLNGAVVPNNVVIPDGFLQQPGGTEFYGAIYNQIEGICTLGDWTHNQVGRGMFIMYVYDSKESVNGFAYNQREPICYLFNKLPKEERLGKAGFTNAVRIFSFVENAGGRPDGIYSTLRVNKLFEGLEIALNLNPGTFRDRFKDHGDVGVFDPAAIWNIINGVVRNADKKNIERTYLAIRGKYADKLHLGNGVYIGGGSGQAITSASIMYDLLAGQVTGDMKMWDALGIYLSFVNTENPWMRLADQMMYPLAANANPPSSSANMYFSNLSKDLAAIGDDNKEYGPAVDFAIKMQQQSQHAGNVSNIDYTANSERFKQTVDDLKANMRANGGILSLSRRTVVEDALTELSGRGTVGQKEQANAAYKLIMNGAIENLVYGTDVSFDDAYEALSSTYFLTSLFGSDNPFLTTNSLPADSNYRNFSIAMYILAGCDYQMPTLYRDAARDMWDRITATATDGPRSVIGVAPTPNVVTPEGTETAPEDSTSDGTHYHTRAELEAKGYIYTEETYDGEQPSENFMQRWAKILDVTSDSLKAFRMAPNKWELYFTPDRKNGYVSPPEAVPEFTGSHRDLTPNEKAILLVYWTAEQSHVGKSGLLEFSVLAALSHVPDPVDFVEALKALEAKKLVESHDIGPVNLIGLTEHGKEVLAQIVDDQHIEQPVPIEHNPPEASVLAPKVKVADGKTNWNLTVGVDTKSRKMVFVPTEKAEKNNLGLVRKREAKPIAAFLNYVFHDDLVKITAKIKSGNRKSAARDLTMLANRIKKYLLATAKEHTPFPGKLTPLVERDFGEGLEGQKHFMRYLMGKATSTKKVYKDKERLIVLAGILPAHPGDGDEEASIQSEGSQFELLIAALHRSPLASHMRVFGSGNSKNLNPGDIDILIDLRGVAKDYVDTVRIGNHLLAIAKMYYGMFDPFLLFKRAGDGKEVLLTRNETATDWIPAKNSSALIAAGLAGKSLNLIDWSRYTERASFELAAFFTEEGAASPVRPFLNAWKAIANKYKAKVILGVADRKLFGIAVELVMIKSDAVRNKGVGTEALRAITNLADIHGMKLVLNPCPIGVRHDDKTALTQKQLESWYSSHGFIQSTKDEYYMERPPKFTTETASTETASVGPRIDNEHGLGAVPNNQEVGYLGMTTAMKPSKFLVLARTLHGSRVDNTFMDEALRRGDAIAAPFLILQISKAWLAGDFSEPAQVMQHEGRHRMLSIKHVFSDEPIETHLFFRCKDASIRNRHITSAWRDALNKGIYAQDALVLIKNALI